MSKLSKAYPGTDFLDIEFKGSNPLISSLLFEKDSIIILGREKSGKSILSLQLMCHLTTQEPFLGKYEVHRPCNVAYVQGEGKIEGTQSNLKMMSKAIDIDPSRYSIHYYPSLPLDTEEGLASLVSSINSWKKPDVIFLDPLYMMMSGDLINNQDARRMVSNIRALSQIYDATIILVHHGHRPKRNQSGDYIIEGDDSIFGSFVWKAYPDHILNLERVKNAKFRRKLTCDTQRMGNIIDSIDLSFIQPDPLFFEVSTDGRPIDDSVLNAYSNTEPKEIEHISNFLRIHYDTAWSATKRLKSSGNITLVNPHEKPHKYLRIR